MRWRAIEIGLLISGLLLLIAFAVGSQRGPVSTYSTYDTGRNGYQALFNVLRSEGVAVDRLSDPIALRDPKTRVIVFTSTFPEVSAGGGLIYDGNDYKALAAFTRSGGKLVYFASPQLDPMRRSIERENLKVTTLDATRFTNLALSQHPQNVAAAYRAIAGRGPVLFDEHLHGYGTDRTIWSVVGAPVRMSLWVVLLALAIVLVDANVRFAPPIVRDPPEDRDSSAYITSMAALLRRARAGRAAITRFAKIAGGDEELERLAQLNHPNDAAVVVAASLFSRQRKDGS